MRNKICFFTAHSPLIGGGGTNFRSFINNLPEFSIFWTYIASEVTPGYEQGYLGRGHMGGKIVTDIWQSWRMLSGGKCATVDRIVNKLLAIDCDSYWIASHNEGLRVAFELTQIQQVRPVHLTINDDWASAICARSFRYRLLTSLADEMTISTVMSVPTFDVTSKGMQEYYLRLTGRKGETSHRYIPLDRINSFSRTNPVNSSGKISVGHLGSIYDKKVFFNFLALLKEFSLVSGREVVLRMWGGYQQTAEIPAGLRDIVQLNPGLAEDEVIPELACCNFVYSMYPLDPDLQMFSRTSMPTKVSSYVLANKPIFGHAPSDSSLAEFLQTTGTGILWDGFNPNVGMETIQNVLALQPTIDQWRVARDNYFGDKNLAVMRKVLSSPTLKSS